MLFTRSAKNFDVGKGSQSEFFQMDDIVAHVAESADGR